MLERGQEKLAGVVLNVHDTETDTLYLIEKLGIRETIWRVLKEVAGQPIVIGYVVILREESAPNLENSGYFLEPCFPVRHVMQYREVEDCIERSVVVWKVRDVTVYDYHPTPVLGEPTTGSLDHLRIEVDRSNATRSEILDLSYNAFARSAADVEDLKPFSAPA